MNNKLSWILGCALCASIACADVEEKYVQTYSQLTHLVNGRGLTPVQMATGSWMSLQYFKAGTDRTAYNKQRFVQAQSLGETAVSGLYVAIHGNPRSQLLVRRELETNSDKRHFMWLNFGTERAFVRGIDEGAKFQPLTRVLPSTTGLRKQLRLLMQSQDALTRRAGLFWGSWLIDDGYRWGTELMAKSDPDLVNRSCAAYILEKFPKR